MKGRSAPSTVECTCAGRGRESEWHHLAMNMGGNLEMRGYSFAATANKQQEELGCTSAHRAVDIPAARRGVTKNSSAARLIYASPAHMVGVNVGAQHCVSDCIVIVRLAKLLLSALQRYHHRRQRLPEVAAAESQWPCDESCCRVCLPENKM